MFVLFSFLMRKSVFLPREIINFIFKMKKILLIASLLPAVMAFSQQYGGMWMPTELNEAEMKKLGMKISAKDIFNPNKPSIKDAVAQFNGGCTSEVISPKGLLLTNHHCGYNNIQSHSSVGNDLLTNGFWAKNMSEELPNPGATADFIVDIKEVTEQVLNGTKGLTDREAEAVIAKNIAEVTKQFKIEPYQRVTVKSMFAGNKYYAYIIETYKDVRLVGAPPQSIGKFGSDTDNWVWPRHTGDFALFRIYADKNNKPAEYSKDNVPYTPKHFLPISIKDIKENDFTFVFGFPGRTNEYLPSIAVEKIINDTNPAKIAVRDVALKTLDEKMRVDDATRIKYASKYASVANYWKKWIGETTGLKKSNAVQKKKDYEAFLAKKNPEISKMISEFEHLYNAQVPFALSDAYFTELLRNAETFNLANRFLAFMEHYEQGKTTPAGIKKFSSALASFYKNYDGEIDAKVTAKLLALYAEKVPAAYLPSGFDKYKNVNQNLELVENWSKNSVLTGRKNLNGLNISSDTEKVLDNPAELIKALKNDPIISLYKEIRDTYLQKVEPKYTQYQAEIDALQKRYMAAQMNTDKERKFFPDANSTLRVTYGKVKGSEPADAVRYHYQTTLDGVMEKYIPNDYEFDVPKKLIDLYNRKDYGIYKNQDGKVPLAFTATNHTTGGNSGSPALDARGNLIGLNFDRQWEGTMSDINYDPRFSRNIMVDAKYILFIIDKFADSKWLIDEMKVVK